MTEELLQCFDETGTPTISRPRSQVKAQPPRYWYGIATIWLVNSKGEILCSQRAPNTSGNPGKWQTYVGGHVGSGQTHLETALRELQEEVGLVAQESELTLIDSGRHDSYMNFYKHYAIRFDGDLSKLRFTDQEIAQARWLNFNKYQREQSEHPNSWCNPCRPEQHQRILTWLRSES